MTYSQFFCILRLLKKGHEMNETNQEDTFFDLGHDDRVLLTTPYTPEMATKMKEWGASGSHAKRQMIAEFAEQQDPGFQNYFGLLATTAEKYGLFLGEVEETGHMALIGHKEPVEEAFADINASYNSRVLTADEYVVFMENALGARAEQGAQGPQDGIHGAN